MPSAAMMASTLGCEETDHVHATFTLAIAERVGVNMVSVYDWATGLPAGFAQPPLRELQALDRFGFAAAIFPFVGTLKRQYRMAPELSAVPRKLFYFDEALHDGGDRSGGVIHLVRVNGSSPRGDSTEAVVFDDGEENAAEVDEVGKLLQHLNRYDRMNEPEPPTIMIITPYSAQRDSLEELWADLRRRRLVDGLALEICTLDSCQGREADVVIISLVKRRTTTFLDNPKRWNVALTRAKNALYLVGDIDAFLDEARGRRRQGVSETRAVSVVARVIDAYQRQLAANRATVLR